MTKLIKPSAINGKISAPASKSMMQRAIAIATLAHGTSKLIGYTANEDSEAALEIAHKLGAMVSLENNIVEITGGRTPINYSLHCGEAGLGIRMFTPIASLYNKTFLLDGAGSLRKRPIAMLEKPLQELGVTVKSTGGFIPIEVTGPIIGGQATVDGSLSSQMLTGLLIALPLAQKDTLLNVIDLKSKPYIDMTIQIMADFGVCVEHTNYETFSIKANQKYNPQTYTIEGDWSGAAFLLVAGALGGEVEVGNLRTNSKQADIAILDAIRQAGATVTISENSVKIKKNLLKAYSFDATECPDLFPPLVALAAHCEGISKIKGIERLKHKESDRATVLKTEFAKLGTKITLEGDTMFIHGGTLKGGMLHANNDHRIAMAGACAAILAQTDVIIENPECIAKSYPGFYDDFEKISSLK
ncbi:MAG: 3-phosphoshikimate 1-carboxyvinyltransferase [Bacteroidales bacterium]|nr:3-phosphoshikimate 1-carboxyvinyltransferase [Bacteroidales bacterium]